MIFDSPSKTPCPRFCRELRCFNIRRRFDHQCDYVIQIVHRKCQVANVRRKSDHSDYIMSKNALYGFLCSSPTLSTFDKILTTKRESGEQKWDVGFLTSAIWASMGNLSCSFLCRCHALSITSANGSLHRHIQLQLGDNDVDAVAEEVHAPPHSYAPGYQPDDLNDDPTFSMILYQFRQSPSRSGQAADAFLSRS